MGKTTHIRVSVRTKKMLDGLKIHRREPYDEVVRRLIEKEKVK